MISARRAISLTLAMVALTATGENPIAIVADCSSMAGFPLQKTQFGLSYVGDSQTDMGNVYELLKARHTRNNDKRLRGTWKGWKENGDPDYERNDRVSTLLERACSYGAIGGANLQGPYEHPAADHYRISSQPENQWNWEAYSRDSVLYYQHLRSLVDQACLPGYPFVFGIGHEANNDANLDTLGLGEGCVDGIAFMGDLQAFHKLVIEDKEKSRGDVVQATSFFSWYRQTMDGLHAAYGDRRRFLITAAQPHTSPFAMPAFMATFKDQVDKTPKKYLPDYVGSHARWNIPGNERFFLNMVGPSRKLFSDINWQAVPVQCNEFGIYDFDTKYRGTLLGAVRLLNNFERMLEAPDIGYVNFIYNTRFASNDGIDLHPAFHAFRFYQDMPDCRIACSSDFPDDLHILASSDAEQSHAALIWRDGSGTGSHTVDFSFKNVLDGNEEALAYLYLITDDNPEAVTSSRVDSPDFGLAHYLADGFPKPVVLDNEQKTWTFQDIKLPPVSIAMLKLIHRNEKELPATTHGLVLPPHGKTLVKPWQWTARNRGGGVDRSWGFFDTRTWTLYAGIEDVEASAGSAPATYADRDWVSRGMAGVEFTNASPELSLQVSVDTGEIKPSVRNPHSLAGIRIDFFNGISKAYESAIILAGNHCPDRSAYSEDSVPWGYGGMDASIIPTRIRSGALEDGCHLVIDLDQLYCRLTDKPDAGDFLAGNRRVIVSACVENVELGMRVRIGTD